MAKELIISGILNTYNNLISNIEKMSISEIITNFDSGDLKALKEEYEWLEELFTMIKVLENQKEKILEDEKSKKIFNLIDSYGSIDGSCYKQWVIDQILRITLGDEEYEKWLDRNEDEGFKWDTGIAP
jgi:hypothetical protein